MTKVFVGVGHGGKDVSLVEALACRDFLEAHGVVVLMSRTKDKNDSLIEEICEYNVFN